MATDVLPLRSWKGFLEVYPKIFRTNINFGFTQATYFSKKFGSIRFIGLDTIEINYEQRLGYEDQIVSAPKLRFVRNLKEQPIVEDYDGFYENEGE